MKKIGWVVLLGVVTLAVLMAMAIAAWLLWDLPKEIGHISIDGRTVHLPEANAVHWVLATLGLLLAAAIVLVVVPTVAVLALILPIVFAALGLAVAALAIGLLLSPLILLVWWLWKRSDKAQTITP
jgi:hypothetical protein